MVGFWEVDVKLFGPVQVYVAPVTVGVVRFKAEPRQTGELEETVGVVGIGFTVTAKVRAGPEQEPNVGITCTLPEVAEAE